MKKIYLIIAILASALTSEAQVYEYQVVTSVESIIPSGLGRSRLISANENRKYKDFTTTRTDGKKVRDQKTNLTALTLESKILMKLNC